MKHLFINLPKRKDSAMSRWWRKNYENFIPIATALVMLLVTHVLLLVFG